MRREKTWVVSGHDLDENQSCRIFLVVRMPCGDGLHWAVCVCRWQSCNKALLVREGRIRFLQWNVSWILLLRGIWEQLGTSEPFPGWKSLLLDFSPAAWLLFFFSPHRSDRFHEDSWGISWRWDNATCVCSFEHACVVVVDVLCNKWKTHTHTHVLQTLAFEQTLVCVRKES